jgi:prevent-host-death family protein
MTMVMSRHMEITATQFKARCLRLLDEVARTGQEIVVTKRGEPVARVSPASPPGDLRGSAKLLLSDDELVQASMGPWDMQDA